MSVTIIQNGEKEYWEYNGPRPPQGGGTIDPSDFVTVETYKEGYQFLSTAVSDLDEKTDKTFIAVSDYMEAENEKIEGNFKSVNNRIGLTETSVTDLDEKTDRSLLLIGSNIEDITKRVETIEGTLNE